MQVFLNAWGGEGYLTTAMVLAMTSMGMFNGLKNGTEDVEIIFNCLDFTDDSEDKKRCNVLYKAQENYYNIIFGDGTGADVRKVRNGGIGIKNDVAVIAGSVSSLKTKYPNDLLLTAGCSESDIEKDIQSGIYGKPWVGEAFHSDARFSTLYGNVTGNIIIINCGGYKGGGTAATFIPLENTKQMTPQGAVAKRFSVIAGPSTTFNHTVRIPEKGVYVGMGVPGIDDSGNVDLFEIPAVLEYLRAIRIDGGNNALHEQNIEFLEKKYEDVYCPRENRDYRSLNPCNYMGRFIDRIRSDESLSNIDASFICIKPNLRVDGKSFNYDETCEVFAPDNQKHKLHITNLINAVTVQELAMNSGKYGDNKIYTFCASNIDKFTVESIFDVPADGRTYIPENVKNFWRFVAFSTIMIKFVYSYFDDIKKAGADEMISKWAAASADERFAVILQTGTNTQGNLNVKFATAVKEEIINFAHEYIKPVLEAFMDVENTSDDVEIFSRTNISGNNGGFSEGVYGIVKNLISIINIKDQKKNIDPIADATLIKKETVAILAAVLTGRFTFPQEFDGTFNMLTLDNVVGGSDVLNKYQASFPEFGVIESHGLFRGRRHRAWENVNDGNVKEKATEYFREIVSYTYKKVKELLIN